MDQVVCFGEILWDMLPTGKKPGGAPMNVALHLHKHGIQSHLISSIGKDQNGVDLKHFLSKQGLSTNHVQEHETLPTGIVDVLLDEQKQATYTIVKPVAWDEISHSPDFVQLAEKAEVLVFGSLACRSETSYMTLLSLLETSKLAIFDMNLRPPHFEKSILQKLLSSCDILKINEHELDYLQETFHLQKADTETLLNELSEQSEIRTICVTLGDKGAAILHEGIFYEHPGFPAKVADTVGAGDAFLASFISGILQKLPMQTVVIRACATGALVASKTGANPEYSIAEVDGIVNF